MNVKPGDLAMWVAPAEDMVHCIGHVVRVTGWATDDPVPHRSVTFEGNLTFIDWNGNARRPPSVFRIGLRRIDSPGDDAVDESHAWLPPVPSKEGQPA